MSHMEKNSKLLSNRDMDTIEETRVKRLNILISEYGTSAALAELLGIQEGQLSQWRNRSIDSKTKRPRSISSDSARLIEERTGKPLGWMDQPVYSNNQKLDHAVDMLTTLSETELIKITGIIDIYCSDEKKISNGNGNDN